MVQLSRRPAARRSAQCWRDRRGRPRRCAAHIRLRSGRASARRRGDTLHANRSRIATTRGSIGHYLAIATLERAGIKLSEVSLRFMQPADAKAALASGNVDAWSTWDPYVALAEQRDHDRSIANGVNLSSGLSFQAATESSIKAKQAEIADFLKRVAAGQRWALTHPDEVAAMQSKVTGLPPAVLKTVYQRAQLHPVQIDDGLIAEQQKTANLYERADVIKTHLDVAPSFDRQFPLAAP
jgi:sulfonate transport system substrate-binding protein